MIVFPTLTKSPSLPLSPDGEIDDVLLRSPQESGYEQVRPRTTRARRSWGVNYPVLAAADVATLRAFEITTLRNGADAFTWTHPISGLVYTVRLTGPVKFATTQDRRFSSAALTLKEV